MGERAREHAALHSWEGAVESWERLLERVVARDLPLGAPVGQQREGATA